MMESFKNIADITQKIIIELQIIAAKKEMLDFQPQALHNKNMKKEKEESEKIRLGNKYLMSQEKLMEFL